MILLGGKAAEERGNYLWRSTEESARMELVAQGMKIIEPNVDSFTEAQQGLYREYLDSKYHEIYEKISAIE